MSAYYTKNIFRIIEYGLLFLFALDFQNNSGYIILALLYFVLLRWLFSKKSIELTNQFIILSIFGLSYLLMYTFHFSVSFQAIVYYLIGPVGGYFIGKSIIKNAESEKLDKQLLICLFIIILGLFIHGSLNMFIKISTGVTIPSEYLVDVWRDYPIARTLQGLFLLPISGAFFAAIFVRDKIVSKSMRVLLLLGCLFSLWSTIMLANRTLIIIFIIVLLISSLIYIHEKKRSRYKFILKLVIFAGVLASIYILDIFNIRTAIYESPLMNRLAYTNSGMLDTGRYERYYNFFKNFLFYPLGGREMPIYLGEPRYVHNVWLDIYLDVGIIPFTLFAGYTVSVLRKFFMFFKICSSQFLKYITLGTYASFLLVFSAEPILSANPYYIIMFLMINGMVEKYVSVANTKIIE